MTVWMLSGLVVAAVIVFLIIRDAQADDKRRKVAKPRLPNNWE